MRNSMYITDSNLTLLLVKLITQKKFSFLELEPLKMDQVKKDMISLIHSIVMKEVDSHLRKHSQKRIQFRLIEQQLL
jgi:hypothetical protein